MVRRPNKPKNPTLQPQIQTSIKGMEINFHDNNAYHCFETKLMFLNEQQNNDTIVQSNNNNAYTVEYKMRDNEWCDINNEIMPKQLLHYSYIITNELHSTSRFSLIKNYEKEKQYTPTQLKKISKRLNVLFESKLCNQIIITDDEKKEIIGHLTFQSFQEDNNGSGVMLALIVFNEDNKRKQIGSIMLTIMDEWLAIKYKLYKIYISLHYGIPNIIHIRKFFRSLYFNDVSGANVSNHLNVLQIIYGPDKNDNLMTLSTESIILLRSTIPISIASCLFFWLYPITQSKEKVIGNKDNNYDIILQKYCKHMMSCLLNGWDNRRIFLNFIMSNVRFILEDVFPEVINQTSYKLYKNIKITSPVDKDEGVNDSTLQLLVKHVRTSPENHITNNYIPGLLTVDLGYSKQDLITTPANFDNNNVSNERDQLLNRKHPNKAQREISVNYEENIYLQNNDKECHCAFFNAAHAIFSNVEQYLLLRYVVSMFYNILSKMTTMVDPLTIKSWLYNVYEEIPNRLAEFYFNDNLEIDDNDTTINKRIMDNASDLFGLNITNVNIYYEKMINGTKVEKK